MYFNITPGNSTATAVESSVENLGVCLQFTGKILRDGLHQLDTGASKGA